MKTNVILVEDENIQAPTISVTAVGPFPVPEVRRGIVEVSGNNVIIRNVRHFLGVYRDLPLGTGARGCCISECESPILPRFRFFTSLILLAAVYL